MSEMDLFDGEERPPARSRPAGAAGTRREERALRPPLADRMRPATFDEIVGQDHLVGPGRPFRLAVESGEMPSLVFWGPPGSGKTTLAKIIARVTHKRFVAYSAVMSGVAEIRQVVATARDAVRAGAGSGARGTILFVDEIHRFNKAQQDAFLPHVESGLITLIGATTENPSFEIISALLSRVQVVVLERLTAGAIEVLLERALADRERGLGDRGLRIEDGALEAIATLADGDARVALNLLEGCAAVARRREGRPAVSRALAEEVLSKKVLRHDRAGDQHYDLISALIKSVRGSDPDAGLYWLARLLAAGEDPLFVARRLVILASEDIGNADPRALEVAVAAFQAVHAIGMPESRLILSQATSYLATAPKSNTALISYERAHADAVEHGGLPVPLHLRNAPTPLMKQLGYGRGYRYPHAPEGGAAGRRGEDSPGRQTYLPDALRDRIYYEPSAAGFEAEIGQRIRAGRRRRTAGKRAGERTGEAEGP